MSHQQENQLYLPRREFESDNDAWRANIRALEAWAEAPKDSMVLVDKGSVPDPDEFRQNSLILVGQVVYQLTVSGWVPIISEGVSKTLFDSKGDLLVGTGNDAVARQAVGVDDSFLVAKASETAGVQWRGILDADIPATIARDAEVIPITEKGAANGVATLGGDGKLPSAQVPALAIGEVFPAASQAAMLALAAQRGDIAVRTDLDPDGVFILTTDNPGVLADWIQITAPGAVISVNGQTGAVVLPTDGAAGTASLRTLGNGATQAAPGNHGHALDDLADVDGLTSRDVGDLLGWDGAQWKPTAPPVGGASSTTYATGSFTVATGNFRMHVKELELVGAERATLEGTARMVISG